MTAKQQMVSMKLERNYRPVNEFGIVGHTRPEIRKKDAAGKEQVVQSQAWIAGEAMPPAFPGSGYPTKVWAGTVIDVPRDEAIAMQRAGIGVPHLA